MYIALTNYIQNFIVKSIHQLFASIPLLLVFFAISSLKAQETAGNYIADKKTGTKVWFKHNFEEDSVTWTGPSKAGLAEGFGSMVGFTNGKVSSGYIGFMSEGKPHGNGSFWFWGDRKLEGNFCFGEPLFLENNLIKKLEKNIVSETDSFSTYVGDNARTHLYYHAIIPEKNIRGVVVLMPSTWESTEHVLSSMSAFCALAYQNQLAVIVPSINQRLTLTDYSITLMNTMFSHAIKHYKLPKDKFIIGGFSMGGILSMRYTELSVQKPDACSIHPIAVFNCDGPCDLANIYNNFKKKYNKNPGQSEPIYGMKELETYCGGSPDSAAAQYAYFSPFTQSDPKGGNAQFLVNLPVRIYGDVDPVWWMKNRHVDMYDLNALDQTAMIQFLNDNGNTKAEFINSYGKGYRLEGNRHPHSWSIIDHVDCIDWILKNIND